MPATHQQLQSVANHPIDARWSGNLLAPVTLLKRYRAPTVPFARKYTPVDIELLVEMDQAHEDVCGPAIAHLLQRAYREYADPRYVRLAIMLFAKYRYSPDSVIRRVEFIST